MFVFLLMILWLFAKYFTNIQLTHYSNRGIPRPRRKPNIFQKLSQVCLYPLTNYCEQLKRPKVTTINFWATENKHTTHNFYDHYNQSRAWPVDVKQQHSNNIAVKISYLVFNSVAWLCNGFYTWPLWCWWTNHLLNQGLLSFGWDHKLKSQTPVTFLLNLQWHTMVQMNRKTNTISVRSAEKFTITDMPPQGFIRELI